MVDAEELSTERISSRRNEVCAKMWQQERSSGKSWRLGAAAGRGCEAEGLVGTHGQVFTPARPWRQAEYPSAYQLIRRMHYMYAHTQERTRAHTHTHTHRHTHTHAGILLSPNKWNEDVYRNTDGPTRLSY